MDSCGRTWKKATTKSARHRWKRNSCVLLFLLRFFQSVYKRNTFPQVASTKIAPKTPAFIRAKCASFSSASPNCFGEADELELNVRLNLWDITKWETQALRDTEVIEVSPFCVTSVQYTMGMRHSKCAVAIAHRHISFKTLGFSRHTLHSPVTTHADLFQCGCLTKLLMWHLFYSVLLFQRISKSETTIAVIPQHNLLLSTPCTTDSLLHISKSFSLIKSMLTHIIG